MTHHLDALIIREVKMVPDCVICALCGLGHISFLHSIQTTAHFTKLVELLLALLNSSLPVKFCTSVDMLAVRCSVMLCLRFQ